MKSKCVDAGREGCPCELAEYGACPVCAKLAGGTCDDCSFPGSCIYSLYVQNGRKQVAGRRERLMQVETVKTYSEDFKVLVIKAEKGFCQKAQTAGAYVFVRAEGESRWHDMPVSVLKAEPEEERIHLGISRCGVKSASILHAAERSGNFGMKIWVRGVYYNGLRGLAALRENAEKAVVFVKGIAAAPFRNFLDGGSRYTKWLSDMRIYADLDKVGYDFFCDYFGDLPAESVEIRSFAEDCMGEARDESGAFENANVLALTSPYYADLIQKAAEQKVVRPADANFCCGEGTCGACTCTDENGKTVHRCKMRD